MQRAIIIPAIEFNMLSSIFSKSKTNPTKYTFNTNLKCSGCVNNLKNEFELHPEILEWNVVLDSKDKLLDIVTTFDKKTISKLIEKAGYTSIFVRENSIS